MGKEKRRMRRRRRWHGQRHHSATAVELTRNRRLPVQSRRARKSCLVPSGPRLHSAQDTQAARPPWAVGRGGGEGLL
eukprot:67260-Pyramimonas_sp.AAC.1